MVAPTVDTDLDRVPRQEEQAEQRPPMVAMDLMVVVPAMAMAAQQAHQAVVVAVAPTTGHAQ